METLREAPKPPADKGFILIVVLWAAVLLALLAAGFSASVRNHVRSMASAMERTRAEAFADAGINLALLDLVSARRDTTYESRFSGSQRSALCRAGTDALLTIRIEDEAGKVNINLANARLLMALFIGLGGSQEQAADYAGRVLDFRDGDSQARARGAELSEYIAAGQTMGPKNAPFGTVDELDQVLGLPAEVTAQIKPFATVVSGMAGVDASKLQPALLALLIAGARETSAAGFDATGLPAEFSERSSQGAYTISATARMASGIQYVSKSIVAFPVRSELGYVLKQWRHGSVDDTDALLAAGSAEPPPC